MITTYDTRLIEVIRIANIILCHPEFYRRIKAVPYFTYTEHSSLLVSQQLETAYLVYDIRVKYYKPWRFSKAMAMVKKSEPNTLNINIRKEHLRDVIEWAACIVHELCHSAKYGHGSNSPKGKENSVPYKAQKIALQLLREMESEGLL